MDYRNEVAIVFIYYIPSIMLSCLKNILTGLTGKTGFLFFLIIQAVLLSCLKDPFPVSTIIDGSPPRNREKSACRKKYNLL